MKRRLRAGLLTGLRTGLRTGLLAGLLTGLLAVQFAAPAQAGTGCESKPLEAANVARAMDLALRTRTALDASGARVALVARVGQDLSKYGLRYSHMAFAWRDHPQGRWLVVHELNTCGTKNSALFNEGLGNFFMDDMVIYEAKIVVPGAATQDRIAALLAGNSPLALHSPRYNMLAYPFSTKYQNSNQWLLEAYAAANGGLAAGAGREQAQAWLRQAGFRPTTLNLPATTRLGARMFRANVAFDDHPFDRRMAGKIDVVTVESVLRFVREQDPEAAESVLTEAR